MTYGKFEGTHDALFDSAWLKWAHGVGHARALDSDIDAFTFNGRHDPLLGVRADYPRGVTDRRASIENRIGNKTLIVQCAVFTAILLREFSAPPEEGVERLDLWEWVRERGMASWA